MGASPKSKAAASGKGKRTGTALRDQATHSPRSTPKPDARKAQRRKTSARTTESIEEQIAQVAAILTTEALSTRKGLRAAWDALRKARRKAGDRPDERWVDVCVRVLQTPFPPHYQDNGWRVSLFDEAGYMLEHINSRRAVPGLLSLLNGTAPGPDASLSYAVYLLGKLGSPAEVPQILTWFEAQWAKTISEYGTGIYRAIADLLIRLQSPFVVAHVRGRLSLHDAGKIGLTANHRFAYEAALESIRRRGPPDHCAMFINGILLD